MKLRTVLAAATMLTLPLAANAQPISGLYVGGGIGANIMQQEHVTSGGTGVNVDSHVGPAVAVSVGYGFGNGLRAELEGDWRKNSLYGSALGGQEQKYGAMVNVLYDFTNFSMIQPYVGVGVGYQEVQIANGHAPGVSIKTDSKGAFAYQAIIGAALPISGAPGWAVTADYRFMGLAGDRTYSGTTDGTPASFKFSNDYNHTFLLGVRYAFGAAPEPAPAPAAPAPAAVAPAPISRSYLVFFDWDKADLTARARQIVSEAAANSTKVQYTRLDVNGYTDTSGSAKYNQALSIRRAQAVAAELVKDGVPKSAIAIKGFGETHLLVPTGPNVREPQNRRVEIIIK